MLLLALASVPEDVWFQRTYAGLDDGWSEDDIAAFQRLSKAEQRMAVRGHLEVLPTPTPEAPRARRSYRKREERLRDRTIRPGTHYVRRHSLDPFLDARVSSGAGKTLQVLISRCGRKRTYRVLTSCLARDIGCEQRTVQRHFKALAEAGYLIVSKPDRKNRTTVYLTPAVEPPPYRKKEQEKSTVSAAESATKSSITQPIKGRTKGKSDGAPFGTERSVVARAPDPGAELPRPALPLDRALVAGEAAPEAPRSQREPSRPGSIDQGASGGSEAEPAPPQEAAAGALVPLARIGTERSPLPPMSRLGDPGADSGAIAWRAKLAALDALIADVARSRMTAG
ncbi:hypothetical protein BK022_08430 [Methylorubrum extorquens]|uniref:Helix-turn-helix domain-containing protein n=1 Tax=Methylorubrum extorquens TaxID=408 RepID=A0A1S1P6R4_METEX|nr:hypothetical protein BK022_08430 [Methylorubrum extorquens]